MDLGPHVIPMTPGGVPVVIHASQYEQNEGSYTISGSYSGQIMRKRVVMKIHFLLLKSDNTYHTFYPDSTVYPGDNYKWAELFYVRPDGYKDSVRLVMSSDQWVGRNTGAPEKDYYGYPHDLYLVGIPEELTEVAGDVMCEIAVYAAGQYEVGRSANFIIRVEPHPTAQPSPTYGSDVKSPQDQQYTDDKTRNNQTPSYYAGDTVDPTLITWKEVVETADTGDLTELIQPGQEIQAVMLTNGQYMGIRCVHVEDYKTAYFESKYLFKAPSEYKDSVAGKQTGYNAAFMWGNPYGMVDGYYAPEILPYEIKSRCLVQIPDATRVFGPSENTSFKYESYTRYQLDYYKTAAGRIHYVSNGEAKEWMLWDADVTMVQLENGGASVKYNGQYGVAVNGDMKKLPEEPPESGVYVPLMWRLEGAEHDNPSDQPIDIQSWQDVKTAAEKGKLKKSTLELGQLMPELPTLGVLRCVHIEDTWAAFDFDKLNLTSTFGSAGSGPASMLLNSAARGDVLTEEETSLFTILFASNKVNYYGQPLSANNTGAGDNVALMSGYNSAVAKTAFDAFSGGASSRKKENNSGTPVEWWSHKTGTVIGKNQTAYWFDVNGNLQSVVDNTSTNTTTRYVNGVFIVGTVS